MDRDSVAENIDWNRLLREFDAFEIDASDLQWDCQAFVGSLLQPVPRFVEVFLERKTSKCCGRDTAIRALYFYLLEKRYSERLNLLHFAFSIFDEGSLLPGEIIDRTPFPHEDGFPVYGCFNDPDF